MRREWVGKNVDLTLLKKCIEDFFRDRGFKTKIDESAGECKILVMQPQARDRLEDINVRILGTSKDFAIELSEAGEWTRYAVRLGYMTTMIGGGSLLLRGLKSREALERLEKEFWGYAEDAVGRLASQGNPDAKCS